MRRLILFGLSILFLSSCSTQRKLADSRDGKVYKTIKIGTQTWMAENLAFKADTGCWGYDNDESNVVKYGRLYNWETATTVCPVGWHLPNGDEWKILINFSGGEEIAGIKLKSNSDWQYCSNIKFDKNLTFNALPFGVRLETGSFCCIGIKSDYWSNETYDNFGAWTCSLNFDSNRAYYCKAQRNLGFYVRCIKDR
jgi:uncharacterized protein (TIGR02145 family)